MDSNTEIVLETEDVTAVEVGDSVAAGDASARALPFSFAKRHGVLIREIKDGKADTVYRTGASPLSLAEARRFAGVPLQLTRVPAEAFDAMLQQAYEQGSNMAMQMVGGLDEDIDLLQVAQELPEPSDLLESDDDAPIIRFINAVLTEAVKENASDVHIEPYENRLVVRFRIDGVLREILQTRRALAPLVVSRIKVMSKLDIAEKRLPQDGRIKMRLSKNRAIDFRVSTCPTLFGEKVVLRILDPASAKIGIDALGYEDRQKALFQKHLDKPYGMILVTGPTGSGKTVSLYTGLNILNEEYRNISTAEDPVEINLVGINQVNVNPKVGLTFASAMRAFLRQDPDVIMVGEIRDLETAEIAIKAAQTGHLVLSTLHTNDAPSTLTRLVDMGTKPYAIATSVSLIIAQRLARRLCENCKEVKDVPREALEKEGFGAEDFDGDLTIFGPVGCKSCNDGYKGRVGIFQVMEVSETMGRIIMESGNAIQIADQAEVEGVIDLRRAGLNKVKEGLTGLEEINRVTID